MALAKIQCSLSSEDGGMDATNVLYCVDGLGGPQKLSGVEEVDIMEPEGTISQMEHLMVSVGWVVWVVWVE